MENNDKKEIRVVLDSSGIFTSLLTVAFIVLRIIGIIDWHWFWVLSPILIPLGLVIFFIIVGLMLMSIASIAGRI